MGSPDGYERGGFGVHRRADRRRALIHAPTRVVRHHPAEARVVRRVVIFEGELAVTVDRGVVGPGIGEIVTVLRAARRALPLAAHGVVAQRDRLGVPSTNPLRPRYSRRKLSPPNNLL